MSLPTHSDRTEVSKVAGIAFYSSRFSLNPPLETLPSATRKKKNALKVKAAKSDKVRKQIFFSM